MFVNYQGQNLYCSGVIDMKPNTRKFARTTLFLIALGVVTIVAILEDGNYRVLIPYVIGVLIVYGVDGVEISYGKAKFRLGDSQTDKDETRQD